MTTTERHPFVSDYAVPPGETLAEVLAERGMTQSELVQRMGRPQKTISEIITGKAEITADTALQLERALGIPARFWGALERNYREDLARLDAREKLAHETDWLKRFPLPALRKLGIIPAARDEIGSMEALLRFFGVATVGAWNSEWADLAVSLRGTRSFAPIPGALATWLRMGEIEAAQMRTSTYDAPRFESSLATIRQLSRQGRYRFTPELIRLCSESGVALILKPEVPGTRVSGATYWWPRSRRTRAVIQLSHRYQTNDHFWFSFFHEAAHVIRHKKRTRFVDLAGPTDTSDPDERDADLFAARTLIPNLDPLILSAGPITAMKIGRFAKQLGIAPGIVVGRLEHDRKVRPGAFRGLKEPYDADGAGDR
jgi:HTH-type transcriptional regulator / antitoxin HigA